MTSITPSLTAKPDPLVIPGTPAVSSNLMQSLEQSLKEVEKLELAQESISAHVYSRSAKSETPHVKHEGWRKEVFTIQSNLAAIDRAVRAQYSISLPFLDIGALKEAFKMRLRLIDRIESVKEDNEPLTKIISAQNYLDTHSFCKVAIKECEAESSAQALEQLFEKKKAEMIQRETKIASLKDPYLPHHIRKLHRNVREFFTHRIATFSPPQQSQEKQNESTGIAKPKTGDELRYVMAYSEYITSFALIALNPLYGFQNATWFGWELYQEHIYKAIWDQIEGLKAVGKGIQPVMRDLQLAIDALRSGNCTPRTGCKDLAQQVMFFEEVHLHLENALKKEKNALLDSKLTVQVHTGLYYAERLLHALSKIRHKIRILSRLSNPDCAAVVTLQERLITYLDSKSAPSRISIPVESERTEVRAFFQACQQLSYQPAAKPETKLSKYIVDFIDDSKEMAKKILAIVGQSTIEQTIKSKDVCKVLIYKNELSELCPSFLPEKLDRLPDELQLFLEKELCRWLYFSDNKQCSFELSLYIALLEDSPKFKEKLDKSLESDSNFKSLITQYQQLAKPTAEEQALLNSIVSASHLLCLPYSKQESQFSYGKAALQIAQMQTKEAKALHKEVTETAQMAYKILEEKRDATRITFRFPTHLPKNDLQKEQIAKDSDQEVLTTRIFSYLTLALWGSDAEKKEATVKIRTYFASRKEPLPELGPTKYLLFLFSITNQQELTEIEKEILPGFFTEYLRNDSFAESFVKQFNLPSIERLLHTFLDRQLQQTIQECRGAEGFEAWKQAVDHFKQFEEARTKATVSWGSYEKVLDQHIKAVEKLKGVGAYVKPISALLKEMRNARAAI